MLIVNGNLYQSPRVIIGVVSAPKSLYCTRWRKFEEISLNFNQLYPIIRCSELECLVQVKVLIQAGFEQPLTTNNNGHKLD